MRLGTSLALQELFVGTHGKISEPFIRDEIFALDTLDASYGYVRF